MKGLAAIALLVVLAMVGFMARPGQAITCGQVQRALVSCLPFLTQGGAPSEPCCEGARSLIDMTPSKADREAACNCMKEAATRYQNIKEDMAAQLPQKCGVPSTIPVSRNVNCAFCPTYKTQAELL